MELAKYYYYNPVQGLVLAFTTSVIAVVPVGCGGVAYATEARSRRIAAVSFEDRFEGICR